MGGKIIAALAILTAERIMLQLELVMFLLSAIDSDWIIKVKNTKNK